MKLTAVRSGQYVVSVNGIDVSRHTTEREALESAVNRELARPGDVVEYRHDYMVRVETSVAVATTALLGAVVPVNPE